MNTGLTPLPPSDLLPAPPQAKPPQSQEAGAWSRSVQTSPWGMARPAGGSRWEEQWTNVHTAPIPLLPSPPTRAPTGPPKLRPQPGPPEAGALGPRRT